MTLVVGNFSLKLVVAFAKCQRKNTNLLTSPVLVPTFIKPFQLLMQEFPLCTSTPHSYISAMLLDIKSLLFFCLDNFEP